MKATLNYDTLNRLTSLTTTNAGYLYTLAPTGTRSNVTELTGRSITWNYDGIYRLTGETLSSAPSKASGSVAYNLDPVGNRLTENSTVPGIGSSSFSYNADDQLSTESYDQNGNVISAGGRSFSYDSQNELVAINGGAVSLAYDAFGNRVAKTASGITTRYLVDDLNPTGLPQVMDELTNAVVTRTYTYGLQRISEDQIVNGAWMSSFYGYDGLGNVRQLTNAAGAITDTNEYNAFGNLLNFTGSTPNVYLYRSEQYDSDLGLYYLRARYYNPLTGRFMSIANPPTLNKYLYTSGDPVNYLDTSGKSLEEDAELDQISLESDAEYRISRRKNKMATMNPVKGAEDEKRNRASLRIAGDALYPNEIGGLLGLEATKSGVKGERFSSQHSAVRRTSFWLL